MVSQENKSGLRNPWPLGMIAAIIVVFIVNGAFIWVATHNRSTLVDRDYSTKDRKTNVAVVNDLQGQKTLSWKTTIRQPESIVVDLPTGYEISVMDREGEPVDGEVEVKAYRASDESKDFSTQFHEVSPGNYQGYISFPLKGYWELRIRIKRGQEIFEVGTNKFMVAAAQ
jgi:hypothetical protein